MSRVMEQLTDEQILAVPELVTRYTATHRPPADSTVSVWLRNFDDNPTHPILTGLHLTVSVTTTDAAYVAELVTRIFGFDAEPESVDTYDDSVVTRWRDTLAVGLNWACPLTAVTA